MTRDVITELPHLILVFPSIFPRKIFFDDFWGVVKDKHMGPNPEKLQSRTEASETMRETQKLDKGTLKNLKRNREDGDQKASQLVRGDGETYFKKVEKLN